MADKTKIAQCDFVYRCPKTWDALYPTNIDSVRYCDSCQRNVFLSLSPDEALSNATQERCVAIPITLTGESPLEVEGGDMMVGMMKGPPAGYQVRSELQAQHSLGQPRWLGLDGCPSGWFYVGLTVEGDFTFGVLGRIEEIDALSDGVELALIDIPIGLLDEGGPARACESRAREVLGRRASSVFPVPSRSASHMPSYNAGSAENQRRLGRKLPRQTWAIVPKIREVDEYLRQHRPRQIREMHPEVAFWALNGRQAMAHNKKKTEGHHERLAVLERYYPRAAGCFDLARRAFLKREVADDDILDALVGAVTAMQSPHLATFPESPPKDEHGLAMEMVFADF